MDSGKRSSIVKAMVVEAVRAMANHLIGDDDREPTDAEHEMMIEALIFSIQALRISMDRSSPTDAGCE